VYKKRAAVVKITTNGVCV